MFSLPFVPGRAVAGRCTWSSMPRRSRALMTCVPKSRCLRLSRDSDRIPAFDKLAVSFAFVLLAEVDGFGLFDNFG